MQFNFKILFLGLALFNTGSFIIASDKNGCEKIFCDCEGSKDLNTHKLSCGHAFCALALQETVGNAYRTGAIDALLCPKAPKCKFPISTTDLNKMDFIDADVRTRLTNVIDDPRVSPQTNDDNTLPGVQAKDLFGKNMVDLFGRPVLNEVKGCPRCFTIIEKLGGCSDVDCSKCKFGFCWYCFVGHEENNKRGHFNKCFHGFNGEGCRSTESQKRELLKDLNRRKKEYIDQNPITHQQSNSSPSVNPKPNINSNSSNLNGNNTNIKTPSNSINNNLDQQEINAFLPSLIIGGIGAAAAVVYNLFFNKDQQVAKPEAPKPQVNDNDLEAQILAALNPPSAWQRMKERLKSTKDFLFDTTKKASSLARQAIVATGVYVLSKKLGHRSLDTIDKRDLKNLGYGLVAGVAVDALYKRHAK